jgi:hypothetical protein
MTDIGTSAIVRIEQDLSDLARRVNELEALRIHIDRIDALCNRVSMLERVVSETNAIARAAVSIR